MLISEYIFNIKVIIQPYIVQCVFTYAVCREFYNGFVTFKDTYPLVLSVAFSRQFCDRLQVTFKSANILFF